ncbi:hypothetical protein K458DRAFT_406502 [Lentithecium fluviatile CBS 122367]|uniref:C2H2-type domain-containing protein n=1 Tax=Lentithecium fluviatile CBS 122367 TaxID=1168545 RepID=A0A6G1IU63_9PLEO|nr:hypothetical protein K458DRAFT_406502 [Lentithecium fluviatile CBS 122367]
MLIAPYSQLTSFRSVDKKDGFKCEHPGCTYRGSFTRKYELNRHSLKHTKGTKHRCPITLCEESFYRTDKLLSHLRQSHTDDDEASCPLRGCQTRPLPWIVMKIHVRNHHLHFGKDKGSISKMVGGISPEERICPIQSCKAVITADSMRVHLQDHDARERIEDEKHILEAGYDPISTKIFCPMCQTWHEEIEDHLGSNIATDWPHLSKYLEILSEYRKGSSRLWDYWWLPSISSKSCCSEMIGYKYHHLGLLRDPEELRPYRVFLLKLCPDLGAYPLFDDIMPKFRRRGGRVP